MDVAVRDYAAESSFDAWLKHVGVLDLMDLRSVFGDDGLYFHDVCCGWGVSFSSDQGNFRLFARDGGVVETDPRSDRDAAATSLEWFLWRKAQVTMKLLPDASLLFVHLGAEPSLYLVARTPEKIMVPWKGPRVCSS